jgi:hypothetical protein
VLGDTRDRLNNDYSPANVAAVARMEFDRWSEGDPIGRFEACRMLAIVNNR